MLQRIVIYLFSLNKEVEPPKLYIKIFFNRVELSYDFSSICEKVWAELYKYIVIDKTKNRNFNGKLRINWDRRIL